MHTPPRYLPARILPAQTPAQTVIEVPAPARMPVCDRPLAGATWHEHEAYLWGVDLYNHGFPWEAHEAWEAPWRVAPAGSPVHAMLQALIQCAAAVIKARAGRLAGVNRLAARACGHFDEVVRAAGPLFLGVDVPWLRDALRAYAAARPVVPDEWPLIELALPGRDTGPR